MTKYIGLIVFFLSGCNLLFPESEHSQSTSTNNRTSTSNNQSSSSNNHSSNSNNHSNTRTTGTTGTTVGSSVELPFTSTLERGRSRKGLVAMWDFTDLSTDTILDKSGNTPAMNLFGSGSISRLPERNGVKFVNGSLRTSASYLFAELTSQNAFTIEAWIKTKKLNQNGPARIITLSGNKARNFTFGQTSADLSLRLRTQDASVEYNRYNGLEALKIGGLFELNKTSHFIWTYDGNLSSLWVDGKFVASSPLPSGISNWDPSFDLRVGNEVDDKHHWEGEMYFLSIYKRVLRKEEIKHHFALGSEAEPKLERNEESLTITKCTQWPFDLNSAESFDIFVEQKCTSVKGNLHLRGSDLEKVKMITHVGGDLIIEGVDEKNLVALSELKSIGGDLIINRNLKLEQLNALKNLTTVGKDLIVTNNPKLLNLEGLSRLTQIKGNLVLNHNIALIQLRGLENIETIEQVLIINDSPSLRVLEMKGLKQVKELSLSNCAAETVLFPALSTAIDFVWIRDMRNLKTFDLHAYDFHIYRNVALETLSFQPESDSYIFIAYNPKLRSLSTLSNIEELAHLLLKDNGLTNVGLNSLRKIKNLEVNNSKTLITLKDEFPELKEVDNLYIDGNTKLTSLENAFPKLQQAGEININYSPKLKIINNAFLNLKSVDSLFITYNDSLAQCDVLKLVQRLIVSDSTSIHDNLGQDPCL